MGFARAIAEQFGRSVRYAIMYGIAFCGLLALFGRPKFSDYPLKYLIFGLGAAVASAFCFIQSLAFSHGGIETVQVGMINYMWPCLTVIFGMLFNGQRGRWWVAIGFLLCIIGIVMVLSGDHGFDVGLFIDNWRQNPLSYWLAVAAALTWAGYSSMTRAWAGGKNSVVMIFFLDWMMFVGLSLFTAGPVTEINWTGGLGWLSILLCATFTSTGYASWNYGMMKGNMTLLAIFSYMTPVISAAFSSWWIHASLTWGFAKGVMLVVIGSLVCWMATLNMPPKKPKVVKVPEANEPPSESTKAL